MNSFYVVLTIFFAHARHQKAYVCLILAALFIAGAGLAAVLVINQAAHSSLEKPKNIITKQIVRIDSNKLTMKDYQKIRQAGLIETTAMIRTTIESAEQSQSLLAIDFLPFLNNRVQYFLRNTAAVENETIYLNERSPVEQIRQLIELKESEEIISLGQLMRVDSSGDFDVNILVLGEPRQGNHMMNSIKGEYKLIDVSSINVNADMAKSFSLHLVAMAGLLIMVCFFVVSNALSMLHNFRMQELQNMRAIGISNNLINLAMFTELLIYSAIASFAGVFAGLLLITSLGSEINQTLTSLLRAPFSVDSVSFFTIALLAVSICIVGSLITLVASLNTRNSQRIWVVLALLSAAISFIAFQYATKWGDLFALASLILFFSLAVSICMPYVFLAAARCTPKSKAIIHWALTSGVEISRACRLSASAYFIALAAMIGLNAMVDSFRLATYSWLSQRLAAPYYLYTDKDSKLPKVDGIQLIQRFKDNGKVNDTPVSVITYPLNDEYKRSMVFDQVETSVWSSFKEGSGVFINQQLSNREEVGLGDTVTFTVNGKKEDKRIIAVYPDYGNPSSEVMVNPSAIGQVERSSAIALHPISDGVDLNWDEVIDQIHAQNNEHRVVSRKKLLSLSMQTFDRTFKLTDMLSLVALIIAASSFAVTIVLLSRHLQSQVGALTALGIDISKIRQGIFLQFTLLCFFVTLSAIPVALLFADLLISHVNVNAFGWQYPLLINWSSISWSGATGMVLVSLTCIFALRRVSLAKSNQFLARCAPIIVLFLSACSVEKSSSIFAGLQQSDLATSMTVVDPNGSVELPQDHASHDDFQLEWWYVTSNLKDKTNKSYPFQFTLFRFNQGTYQRYMAHTSLHTPNKHWFEERFSESDLPSFNYSRQPFSFILDDWRWHGDESGAPFPANLVIPFYQGPKLSVSVDFNGPYVFHGANGISIKSSDRKHMSYYYSQPYLEINAQVEHADKTIKLSGKGWYDHEWTSQLVDEQVSGWDWVSLHLEDGSKLMAFRLRIDQNVDFVTSSFISKEGIVSTYDSPAISMVPVNSASALPLQWKLELAEKGIDINLEPMKKNQWNCGMFEYYEGGVTASGSHAAEGFIELTGYVPRANECSP